MSIHDKLRKNLLQDLNLDKPKFTGGKTELEHEWSDKFIQLMRNGMKMGAYRYGSMWKPSSHSNIQGMQVKLKAYIETGNADFLRDIANIAMVEFVNPEHTNYHFDASDDKYHKPKL